MAQAALALAPPAQVLAGLVRAPDQDNSLDRLVFHS